MARAPRPEDLYDLRIPTDLDLSPDGRFVVFSVKSVAPGKEGYRRSLWLAPAEFCPPGGESFTTLAARTARGIERWNRSHPGRDIVAVAHGGTIRAALGNALGLPPARALAFETANCALTRLDYIEDDGKASAWRVVAVNLLPTA